MQRTFSFRSTRLAAGLVACGLSGCAGTPDASGIYDPIEPVNRQVHGFNRAVDTVFVSPAADAYGAVVPRPVQRVVGNVADTLDLPGDIVNDVLQANPKDAATNSLRLAANLTMGVFGLFDAATALGLPEAPTDFGETLAVWGVGEGAYMELPFVGPSTARDATGLVVDIAANPVRILTRHDPATANATTLAKLFARLGDRDRYRQTVDSILYDSADSYVQSRLLYLQNRRFALRQSGPAAGGGTDDGFVDPYAEAEPPASAADAAVGADFVDPYEDPYGP